MDISALTGCLEREEKARTEEAAEHATSAAALQKNIADLQVCITKAITYHLQLQHCKRAQLTHWYASSRTSSPTALYFIPCTWL